MLTPADAHAQAMPEHMLKHHAASIAQAMPYVRNVRTYVQLLTLNSYLTLNIAHRGVARIRLSRIKASAPRGQETP